MKRLSEIVANLSPPHFSSYGEALAWTAEQMPDARKDIVYDAAILLVELQISAATTVHIRTITEEQYNNAMSCAHPYFLSFGRFCIGAPINQRICRVRGMEVEAAFQACWTFNCCFYASVDDVTKHEFFAITKEDVLCGTKEFPSINELMDAVNVQRAS